MVCQITFTDDRVTSGMRPSGTRKLKKLQKNLSSQSYSTFAPDVVTESEFSPIAAKVEDEVNSPGTLAISAFLRHLDLT